MIKKIFSFLVVIALCLVFVGCDVQTGGSDEGTGSEEGSGKTAENYEYTTPETDKLKLTEEYEGKNFITDGIGEATVSQYVDGDTTIFKCKGSSTTFTVRYLGINTPESTYKVEPWGFTASKYTKNALKNAAKIVLQADDLVNRLDSTGRRYLAWVWIIDENGDSRLLNLELVEVALAQSKSNSDTYRTSFINSVLPVSNARCRIYGETDPDYDYSTESAAMSLKEIREQYGTTDATEQDSYKGKKVVVSGVVTRNNGNTSCYLQQYDEETDEYYGIYVYGGFTKRTQFSVGNSVVIEAKIGYYYGSLQLTDVSNIKLRLWGDTTSWETMNATVNIEDVKASDLTISNTKMYGRIVKLENVKFTGGYDPASETNAFTLYTNLGIDIRVDSNILLKDNDGNRITTYEWFKNKTASSIICIVSYYDYNTDDSKPGNIQLMLTSMNDIDFVD